MKASGLVLNAARAKVFPTAPSMSVKRKIEVDDATAAALESRAANAGLSVSELLAQMVAAESAATALSATELAELDRQWAAIKGGEPTVAHDDVVRWLDTWGTSRFRSWQDR
jgi:predicted transcriptional regulator